MNKDALKSPNTRELALLEMLKENPELTNYIEELAMMTRDPGILLSSASEAEEKMTGLCRGIGKCGLQQWAQAANEQSERSFETQRTKGRHRHGKKNSTG